MAILMSELPYETDLAAEFPGYVLVRSFRAWALYASPPEEKSLIIRVYHDSSLTLFIYQSIASWDKERHLIENLSDSDDGFGEAGVPAFPRPTPPSRVARDAKPLPGESGSDG
jgi:hypothetical protein